MRTLVVSDLHLGASSRTDILRRPEVRAALVGALDGVDRLVILGDGLELREMPLRGAAAHARDLLTEAGAALGPEGEIVMLSGNHDHALVSGWLEARTMLEAKPPPLGVEQRIDADDAGPVARTLAAHALPARLTLAYPGIWLRDDVFATHGHYSDLHTTVPTFERLASGSMARWAAELPEAGATPEAYEACLAPIYAWMHALAQRTEGGRVKTGAGSSARVWMKLSGRKGARTPSAIAMRAGFVAAVGLINRAGVGPVSRDISGEGLRRGALYGIGEVVRRLGIDAGHVIWGHSHRAGPLPGDDLAEWTAPTGARIHNTGSWVYQSHFVGGDPGTGPYWPGSAIVVESDRAVAPRLIRLLADRTHAELAPA
jgi:hypothetical protein